MAHRKEEKGSGRRGDRIWGCFTDAFWSVTADGAIDSYHVRC
ncbi:MAG TPA: hypothetical protein VK203_10685 [Nostocaceae cyanobacterium]|nr:hypothetical protein [Nostocaceae cyanobacterium]